MRNNVAPALGKKPAVNTQRDAARKEMPQTARNIPWVSGMGAVTKTIFSPLMSEEDQQEKERLRMRRRQTDVPGIPLQLEMGRGPERGVNFLGLGRVQRLLEVHEAPARHLPAGPQEEVQVRGPRSEKPRLQGRHCVLQRGERLG